MGCAELHWAFRDFKYVGTSDGASAHFSVTE
jgi:hypothetical protein